jgi:tRNA-Thr(GGU) m(6)t(6)A37 methyltransferase TsaA
MSREAEQARMQVAYEPIGVVHTPFKERRGMPIQPAGGIGIAGTVEVFPEFADGLKDLAGFSHVFLLYYFHRVRGTRLTVTPFMDVVPRGVFATRAPVRPNPIGLSVVKLVRVDGNILHVENLDILDGTPLLDIKPYVPEFDEHPADRIGWLAQARGRVGDKRSDDRFE